MMVNISTATAIRRALLLGSCLAAMAHSPALADPQLTVRVSGGVGVENNPFLVRDEEGDEEGVSVAAEVQVEPSLLIQDDRTTFRLFANARLRQFFGGYDTTGSLALGANGTTKIDERTTLSSGARFQTSRSAAQDAFLLDDQDLIALEPDEVPDAPIIDPTIAGSRGRFTSYGLNAGATRQLSPRDSASVGIAFNEGHTSGELGRNFRSADLSAGYGRQLDERTTLRGSVVLTKSDFVGFSTGDAISVTPLVGVQQRVSERLNWSGQIGLSYSQVENPLGEDVTATTLALALSGCRRDLRGALCVSAQRQPRPTAFDGFANTTAVSVGYDTVISQRDSIGFSANYRQSERIASGPWLEDPLEGSDEFVGLGASYRRTFTNDLSGYATASYSKAFTEFSDGREANVAVYVGLSYLFGRRR